MVRATSVLLMSIAVLACAPPDLGTPDAGLPDNPHREDLDASWDDFAAGLQTLGVPTEPGALAGTYARRATSATIVNTVVSGMQTGGGVNWLLSHRTWNADEQFYEQQSELCGGYNFDVASVGTGVRANAYRAIPVSTLETVRVDTERGTFLTTDHIQLWAVRDLPDPLTTPMPPDTDTAALPPWDERLYDMDGDGEPGFTLEVSGLLEGEVYLAQRKSVDLAGVVTLGGTVGFTSTTYSQIILGNNNPVLSNVSQGSADEHPERDVRWFAEVKVDDDMTCDDVLAEKDTLFPTGAAWSEAP